LLPELDEAEDLIVLLVLAQFPVGIVLLSPYVLN
jgi:hypothetical protein